ncbi:hypothetical protein [Streptomyces sp. NRRL F-2580]|uniref:hypothetical protein n=1 Tax=Streptomyces sp. NRRL F-2580 TaxID=1463841 RepID=UPI00131CFB02|nr:hypothetical protein [Streptomyces sp. NRRL F-2580]
MTMRMGVFLFFELFEPVGVYVVGVYVVGAYAVGAYAVGAYEGETAALAGIHRAPTRS